MRRILVSACLYGECTRYDGKNNILKNPFFLRWKNMGVLIPVCPEVMGGLKIPRPCSEICGERVINEKGEDVTENFEDGARKTLDTAKKNNVLFAILKQGSPSCGCKQIYDGSFTGVKKPGTGVAARLLLDNGFVVFDENDIATANLFYMHALGKNHHKK